MSNSAHNLPDGSDVADSDNPPVFNVPWIVVATIVLLTAVHVVRMYGLGEARDERFVLNLAFIPGCYSVDCVGPYGIGRSPEANIWSPFSHALLHGDWTHLGLNVVWLLAFGTPVARRLGATGYVLFSIAGALAGAALFYLMNSQLLEPVIGASGVVSALMGGACRFAFGALGRLSEPKPDARRLGVLEALSDRTILFFVLVFFATNLLTASSFGALLGGGAPIAWEAHLGGFAFGFLCFGLFDRRVAI